MLEAFVTAAAIAIGVGLGMLLLRSTGAVENRYRKKDEVKAKI